MPQNQLNGKEMNLFWASVFLLFPLLALSYVGWHVWALLPFSSAWKSAVLVVGLLCFLLLLFDVSGRLDTLPGSVAI